MRSDRRSIVSVWTTVTIWKRTNTRMFRASSTCVRSETSNIFRVIAHALACVDVKLKIGALLCRFNVSTAFRGVCLLCFVHKPTCFNDNVLVTTTCYIPCLAKSIAIRNKGGVRFAFVCLL